MVRPVLLFPFFFVICVSLQAHAETGKAAADRVYRSLESVGAGLPRSALPAEASVPEVSFVRIDPNDPWTMGVLRVMRVRAPVARMLTVLEDVANYVGLFKNLLVAKRVSLAGKDDYSVETETYIPVPLLANDHTSVRYKNEKTGMRRLTSFALAESNHLDGLDGASLLVGSESSESVYWQLSIVHVGYGSARALPARVFWVENALGNLQADWALKLRAEQPELGSEVILKRSEELSRAQGDRVKAAFEKARSLDEVLGMLAAPKALL